MQNLSIVVLHFSHPPSHVSGGSSSEPRTYPSVSLTHCHGRDDLPVSQARPHPPGSGPSSALLDSLTEHIWAQHSRSEQSGPWIPPEISPGPRSFLDPPAEPYWDKKDPLGECQCPTFMQNPEERKSVPLSVQEETNCSQHPHVVGQQSARRVKKLKEKPLG